MSGMLESVALEGRKLFSESFLLLSVRSLRDTMCRDRAKGWRGDLRHFQMEPISWVVYCFISASLEDISMFFHGKMLPVMDTKVGDVTGGMPDAVTVGSAQCLCSLEGTRDASEQTRLHGLWFR